MMIKSSEFTKECGFYYGIALAFGLQQFGKNVGCVSLAFIWFCAFLVLFLLRCLHTVMVRVRERERVCVCMICLNEVSCQFTHRSPGPTPLQFGLQSKRVWTVLCLRMLTILFNTHRVNSMRLLFFSLLFLLSSSFILSLFFLVVLTLCVCHLSWPYH